MTRLGLKLFYLRTREKRASQHVVADALGIRQATLSHIEQGNSLPTAGLLIELCRFFDVTPTFLLDDDRGVLPAPTDRWHLRQALVTVGMWVEVPAESLVHMSDGSVLCPLLPGGRFYDQEAAAQRRQAGNGPGVDTGKVRRQREQAVARALEHELASHPQHRRSAR